ncbi:protocatechuate dioxygenase [Streptomyces sp. JH002]|uniref:dioxygenase family protein n=1 Tax=Streptomyces sp. JH002 TaxID=2763259 RepID=UPI003D808434
MTDYRLSRRRILTIGGLGAAGFVLAGHCPASAATGAATPVHPTAGPTGDTTAGSWYELTTHRSDSPYTLTTDQNRQDITDGKQGVPLALDLTVRDSGGSGAALPGAAVEVWHCDAWGYYSGYTDANPGGEVRAEREDRSGADPDSFLRGYQVTDREGRVAFRTIVPGWYAPRAPHIHVRVHLGAEPESGGFAAEATHFTGQLFLPDELVAEVYELEPYAQHIGDGPATLARDIVYAGGGERDGLLSLERVGTRGLTEGCSAAFTLAVPAERARAAARAASAARAA